MSLLHYIAIGPGNGRAIWQTEDIYYVCDDDCARDAVTARVSREWADQLDTVAVWAGEPCRYSDGRPTGDVTTWEYAVDSLSDRTTSGHEWCWNPDCGALVSHGTDDTTDDDGPYVCDGDTCSAPEFRPEPV